MVQKDLFYLAHLIQQPILKQQIPTILTNQIFVDEQELQSLF